MGFSLEEETMKMALLLGSFQKALWSSPLAGGTRDKADSSRGTPSSMTHTEPIARSSQTWPTSEK